MFIPANVSVGANKAMTTNTQVSVLNVKMEKSMNLFEDVINEETLDNLTLDQLKSLSQLLDKVK